MLFTHTNRLTLLLLLLSLFSFSLPLELFGERWAHTENAGHDGDARVFGLPLGIVDAQRFQRRETDCLGAPGHVGRIGAVRKKD